jgi:hypothetical protein
MISRIAMAKAEFSMNNPLSTSKFDFNLRRKIEKCHTWSTALCDVETWTLRK